MDVCQCKAQNSHDTDYCECEGCFRANGGTFVYGADDLDVIDHSGGDRSDITKPPKEKWSEHDIREMISIWASKEVLVSPKHVSYYNTRERTNAIEEIRNELAERGIHFTTKQVNDKMINLRTYYGSQKRQIEASKRNALSPDDIFVSRWKFFDSLKFLSDTIVSRSSVDVVVKAADSVSENGSTLSPTGVLITPTTRPYLKRKRYSTPSSQHFKEEDPSMIYEEQQHSTRMPINETSFTTSEKLPKSTLGKTQDEIFGELITAMVSEIPECHEKAMLKLEIQHKIISTLYKTSKKY